MDMDDNIIFHVAVNEVLRHSTGVQRHGLAYVQVTRFVHPDGARRVIDLHVYSNDAGDEQCLLKNLRPGDEVTIRVSADSDPLGK